MQERHAFGNYLRRERELRQIPLSEVAAATKIPLRALQSLEDGAWDDLPAEVFVRGFVRSYARHVGLPPEDACRRFSATAAELRHRTAVREVESVGESATDVGGRRRFGLALFVIIILIIATITLSLLWRRGASAETHSASLDSGISTPYARG